MTLTLELRPELERRLQAESARRGMAVVDYALLLLETSVAAPQQSSVTERQRTREERLKAFNDWMDRHDPNLPPLSDEAVSRESFYEGRD